MKKIKANKIGKAVLDYFIPLCLLVVLFMALVIISEGQFKKPIFKTGGFFIVIFAMTSSGFSVFAFSKIMAFILNKRGKGIPLMLSGMFEEINSPPKE